MFNTVRLSFSCIIVLYCVMLFCVALVNIAVSVIFNLRKKDELITVYTSESHENWYIRVLGLAKHESGFNYFFTIIWIFDCFARNHRN